MRLCIALDTMLVMNHTSGEKISKFGANQPVFAPFAVPTISGCSKAWEEILHLGVRRAYPKRSIVTLQSDELFDILYIEKGKVCVVFDSMDGRNRAVVFFEAGSMVNLACSASRQEASGQYECVEDSVIWRIPGKVLHDADFISLYPELVKCVVKQLGTLVLTYHTALTDMLMDDFIIRFCRFLLSLSIEQDALELRPSGSQEKIASMLGVHRTTLARAIQRLKKEGIISSFTHRKVEILNLEKLRRMASL